MSNTYAHLYWSDHRNLTLHTNLTMSDKACANPSTFSRSRLVVGSSSARRPQLIQNVSARASRMIMDAKTWKREILYSCILDKNCRQLQVGETQPQVIYIYICIASQSTSWLYGSSREKSAKNTWCSLSTFCPALHLPLMSSTVSPLIITTCMCVSLMYK